MADLHLPVTLPAGGDIVAVDVSADEYMERYAADFYEWVNGVVIKMSPVSSIHDDITVYLRGLLNAYFALNPIGRAKSAPFVMRLDAIASRREPDLQVILHDNPGEFTSTVMIGAADICIEVVSPESDARDYGEKFKEYEAGGVPEYWIIDPAREDCRFYRLNEKGIYKLFLPDADSIYETPKLPRLKLHVPTLWRDELPDILQVVESVKAMFA